MQSATIRTAKLLSPFWQNNRHTKHESVAADIRSYAVAESVPGYRTRHVRLDHVMRRRPIAGRPDVLMSGREPAIQADDLSVHRYIGLIEWIGLDPD